MWTDFKSIVILEKMKNTPKYNKTIPKKTGCIYRIFYLSGYPEKILKIKKIVRVYLIEHIIPLPYFLNCISK